jgi:hypothetical protein
MDEVIVGQLVDAVTLQNFDAHSILVITHKSRRSKKLCSVMV